MSKDKTPEVTRHGETDPALLSVDDVFSRLERGDLTSEQADDALTKIRERAHTWLERHARYFIPLP
jgi:hypothetical protein